MPGNAAARLDGRLLLVRRSRAPLPTAAEIAAGVRDAVVLECWEEAFSAYPEPDRPDRAGARRPRHGPSVSSSIIGLRLLGLAAGEDCGNLDRMENDLDAQGHLTVTPAPTAVIAGDCPVQAGGGFTGFEHYLYRIEIATPDGAGNARFKYSTLQRRAGRPRHPRQRASTRW